MSDLPISGAMSISPARALAAEVMRAEADAIGVALRELDDQFDRAVDLLATCQGSVIVSGMGKSGLIGQKACATLASTGTPAHTLHPAEALHGDLGRIRKEDVLLLLSYSGSTEELLTLAALVRQDGGRQISVTGSRTSRLAQLTDVHVCLGNLREACPHNLAPTASTTAMLAVCDALALAASQARGFGAEDFHRRHPGGQLGRQLLPVGQALRFRAGEGLLVLSPRLTVAQALAEADRLRDTLALHGGVRPAGALLLADESGKLCGIFTDADFRRLMAKAGPTALQSPLEAVMTRRPSTLLETDLIRDAVQLVRERRLDEIPVVDATGAPVGLLDVQDLIALRVVD